MRTLFTLAMLTLATQSLAQVAESEYVEVGAIDQWISIRGSAADNPVLLILHGGPGVSNAAFAHAFDPLKEHFILVDWDQRGAGRTFGRNGGADGNSPMTLDRLVKDGIELAEHLRSRLGKDKITLLAMSFGSVIGLKMVAERPDLFAAYVATGQVISRAEGDARGYALTLAEAKRTQNDEAIAALEAIGPPPWPDAETWNSAKGWATRMTREEDPASEMRVRELMGSLLTKGYTRAELGDIAAGSSFAAARLAPHLSTFDARRFATELDVPVFIFQGERDLNAVTSLVEEWFDELRAPRKELQIIENASHGAFYANANELGEFLIRFVIPAVR